MGQVVLETGDHQEILVRSSDPWVLRDLKETLALLVFRDRTDRKVNRGCLGSRDHRDCRGNLDWMGCGVPREITGSLGPRVMMGGREGQGLWVHLDLPGLWWREREC